MEKIFLPYQISMLMPAEMFKVMVTLFAYQKEGTITYSKRNCEFLHLDQAIVEQCIQTAINYKLIEFVEQSGGVYKFKINVSVIEAAKLTPLTAIPEKPILKLADEITWKQQATTKEMSPDELLAEIEKLKRQLMSKVKDNNDASDLPW